MEIRFFDVDIERFIWMLQKPTIAKVLRTIELLEQFGPSLGMPQSKCIGRSLFELRIPGSQEVRLIYTFHGSRAVILHGFIKKTSKIPLKELDMAQKRKTTLDNI